MRYGAITNFFKKRWLMEQGMWLIVQMPQIQSYHFLFDFLTRLQLVRRLLLFSR